MLVRMLKRDKVGARSFEPGIQEVPDALAGDLIAAGSAQPIGKQMQVNLDLAGPLTNQAAGRFVLIKRPPRGEIA